MVCTHDQVMVAVAGFSVVSESSEKVPPRVAMVFLASCTVSSKLDGPCEALRSKTTSATSLSSRIVTDASAT